METRIELELNSERYHYVTNCLSKRFHFITLKPLHLQSSGQISGLVLKIAFLSTKRGPSMNVRGAMQ